jgi:hypothetical protein
VSQSVSFKKDEELVNEQLYANELKQSSKPTPSFDASTCQQTGKENGTVVNNDGRVE